MARAPSELLMRWVAIFSQGRSFTSSAFPVQDSRQKLYDSPVNYYRSEKGYGKHQGQTPIHLVWSLVLGTERRTRLTRLSSKISFRACLHHIIQPVRLVIQSRAFKIEGKRLLSPLHTLSIGGPLFVAHPPQASRFGFEDFLLKVTGFELGSHKLLRHC